MELLDLLRAVSLFNGLTNDQLQQLIAISAEEIYDDGEVVFQQGTEGDKLYLIRDGQIEILIKRRPEESERTQVFLGRGQVVGEMALIDFGTRSATARSSWNGTVLYSISRDGFTDLCNQDTAIGYIVMRNMAMELSFKLRHANLESGE
jgi:CRP/FNR family transcriptional regulator, cyclic AMP receptor protein